MAQVPAYDKPQSPLILSQARPALGLALALGLPGFLLYQKLGGFLLCLVCLSFLALAKWGSWRLPWLKGLLLALFLLNLCRAAWGLKLTPNPGCDTLCTNWRIGPRLWESQTADQACVIASPRVGQKVALILPKSALPAKKLQAKVVFCRPQQASNPGGFDEAAWLAGYGIFLKAETQEIISSSGRVSPSIKGTEEVKSDLKQRLSFLLGSDSAGLVLALCLGDKTGLSDLRRAQFSSLALAHLTAVSGLHLAYVLLPLRIIPVAKLTGKRVSSLIQYSLILGFYWFTGRPPGLLRAGLVLATRDLSKLLRLRSDPLNSLALALSLACLLNPFALLHRGLMWSFAAAAALFLFAEPLNRKLRQNLPLLDTKSSRALAVAFSTQAAISLLNKSQQGRFKLLSLIWQLPLTLLAQLIFLNGLPLLALAAMCPRLFTKPGSLLQAWAWLIDRLAQFFLQTCQTLSTINWPGFLEPRLTSGLIFALILAAGYQLYSRRRRNWLAFHGKQRVMRNFCRGLLAASYLFMYLGPSLPVVHFLDVGQGDAMVFSWGNQHMLIDGGTSDQALKVILPFMASQGISHFDAALISHAHADHLGAAAQLMAWGKIHALYLPEAFSFQERLVSYLGEEAESDHMTRLETRRNGEEELGQEVLVLAKRQEMPIYRLKPGDQISWQGPALGRSLVPSLNFQISKASQNSPDQYRDANESGLVVSVNWGKTNLLLTGDLTPRKEALWLAAREKPAAILKVGHHGAKNVTSEEFLERAQVRAAIISVGPNCYGHPNAEVLARLSEMEVECLRTDQDGAIKVGWDLWGHCGIETYKSKKHLSGLE